MYAIIATGGKQYKVEEGQTLDVELLHAEAGETVDIDAVLMLNKDGEIVTGKLMLKAQRFLSRLLKTAKHLRSPFSSTNLKRTIAAKKGHRQPYTRVTVESIVG